MRGWILLFRDQASGLFEEATVSVDIRRRREETFREGAGTFSHLIGFLRVFQKPTQSYGNRLAIARRYQEAVVFIHDHLADATDSASYHGPRAGHRFEDDPSQTLGPGRENQSFGLGHLLGQLALRERILENHSRREAELFRL